ncbi:MULTISPECIES: FadR/GntR family transcriptional regulator [Bacillus]|uniref:FadR/GntR family transcriptional regulator n=1 Tax=Bacillus TaxID=1386 RepID=UPI000E70AB05|nr:FadR/GntR family transcriptional regulator [Bacillus safensis]MCY1092489.1 FadR/GntR family transcriptional regulator [Bacillus safensis]RKE74861.1 GntR family transcriptional regulator [Bacillus safensis]USY28638.1 FadR family transcriptional regulator [Bacillus safensis]GLF86343.1 HTH-type transcriptional regulator LutR [Bacillus safensis]
MKYKQIKTKKIYEEIADALIESIRTGELLPGEKLDSVQALSESFQVSRSAVREALSALKAIGLIEMKQGEGTYVKQFDPEQLTFSLSPAFLMKQHDVTQLLELRTIIETGAVKKAALLRTDDDLHQLREALEQMKLAEAHKETGEEADLSFHLAIATASKNDLLKALMNHVSTLLVETMRETRKAVLFSKKASIRQLYKEHEHIYKAVLARQPEEAERAMLTHLKNVEKLLSDVIQEPAEESEPQ